MSFFSCILLSYIFNNLDRRNCRLIAWMEKTVVLGPVSTSKVTWISFESKTRNSCVYVSEVREFLSKMMFWPPFKFWPHVVGIDCYAADSGLLQIQLERYYIGQWYWAQLQITLLLISYLKTLTFSLIEHRGRVCCGVEPRNKLNLCWAKVFTFSLRMMICSFAVQMCDVVGFFFTYTAKCTYVVSLYLLRVQLY